MSAASNQAQGAQWVSYNPSTDTYDTPDGTKVAAELVDGVACLADVLHIAAIRGKQRAAIAAAQVSGDHFPDAGKKVSEAPAGAADAGEQP